VNPLPLIGRLLFAGIFIVSGLGHLMNHAAMAVYAESQGVPLAGVAVPLTGLLILGGGLAVLAGFRAKLGALGLFFFLVPTALMVHKFWGLEDPINAQNQMAHFMKNISLAGAALMIAYFGTGPFSMEKQKK
jgi:putative oxidoreductase